MGVDLSQYNNSWYNTGASKFKVALWFIVKGIFFLNPLFPFIGFKVALLRMFGAKVGNGVVIKPSVNIKYPWSLEIGNNVWIGELVWIENHCKVSIGNNVCLSQGASLMTGNHDYKKPTFDLVIKSVILEDGVWIGTNAIVCPGVNCGTHSILTVNSVANKDLEPYWIYQGNPAEKVRERMME